MAFYLLCKELELIQLNKVACLTHVFLAAFAMEEEVVTFDCLPFLTRAWTAITHNSSGSIWISTPVLHLMPTCALRLLRMCLEIEFFENPTVIGLFSLLILQLLDSCFQFWEAIVFTSFVLFGFDLKITFWAPDQQIFTVIFDVVLHFSLRNWSTTFQWTLDRFIITRTHVLKSLVVCHAEVRWSQLRLI